MTDIECVRSAFQSTFGISGRPFGASGHRWIGVSDDAKGVQWNAGYDRQTGVAIVGVNLEGMRYDGWPIARFIERELATPMLPTFAPDLGGVIVSLMRDAWQFATRPQIAEHQIGDRASLASLTRDSWLIMLREAYECLNPQRSHRGRAEQWVTLNSGRVQMEVSPHLHLGSVIWEMTPTPAAAEKAMRAARDSLKPLYEFVQKRSQ